MPKAMTKKRLLKIPIRREVIDEETGEVSVVPDEMVISQLDLGAWIKLTLIERETDYIPLDGLGKQFVVFYVILKRVIWEDCTVDIGPATKAAITSNAKIKGGMIRKYLNEYVKCQLMKKVKGTSYMINPQFFFKGLEDDQKKLYIKYITHGKIQPAK